MRLPRIGSYIQIMQQGGPVGTRARERMLLAGFFVCIDQSKDRIEILATIFSDFLNQFDIVDWIDGKMVAGIVTHFRSFDIEFDVHAGSVAALVQLPVDFDLRQEGVFGIKGSGKIYKMQLLL